MKYKVLRTITANNKAAKKWKRIYGNKLICVRYRGDKKARKRITTIEIEVDCGFWMPYKKSL